MFQYPLVIAAEDRTVELEAKMMKMLALVGIEYLVERWSGATLLR